MNLQSSKLRIGTVNWYLLVSFLCLFAILHQSAKIVLTPDFNPDKTMQIAATQSLLNREGLTIAFASSENLGHPQRSVLEGYPPGYSFLLAPILALLGNLWWSAQIVDWFAIAIFFGSWFVILALLGNTISKWSKLAIWMYWALIFPPLFVLPHTDALALAFYSAGLGAMMFVLRKSERWFWMSALSGLLVGMSAAMRFAYWPLVIVISLALGFCAFLFKYPLVKPLIVQAVVALGMIGSLQLYQFTVTSKVNYLAAQTSGWYWNQLWAFYPFPASAIGADFGWQTFLYDGVRKLLPLSDMWREGGLWVLAGFMAVSFLVAVIVSWRDALANNRNTEKIATAFFFIVGALTLIITIGLLSYLAVRYPGQFGGWWVYVNEKRYYGPVFGFLVVGLVYTLERLVDRRKFRGGKLILSVAALLTCIIILSVGLWRVRDWKIQVTDYLAGNYSTFGRENQIVMDAVRRARDAGLPVVYVNDLPGSFYTVGAAAVEGAWIGSLPENEPIATTQPVKLILAVPIAIENPRANRYKELCIRAEGARVGEYKNYWLCEMMLHPQSGSK